ncbi:MAG TPA: hypothetical protein VGF99_09185 [Myxococcota bacterium]
MPAPQHVKGVLFVDYVRMIRGRKDIDWAQHLDPGALSWVHRPIDLAGWYPMPVFEVLGNAILEVFGIGELELARLWGHQSVELLIENNPLLFAPGNPVETVNRVRVLRSTYFDFDALTFAEVLDDELMLVVRYGMGARAEEAATYQTLGFFEALLQRAGATDVVATVVERSWAGEGRTAITYRWTPPG